MKKRLLSILLCLAMLLTLLPAAALAFDTTDVSRPDRVSNPDRTEETSDTIWVSGVELQKGEYLAADSTEPTTTRPADNYVSWNGDNILYMQNYTSSEGAYFYTEYDSAVIYCEQDFLIRIVGTNTLLNPNNAGDGITPYYCDLTVSGSGTLNLDAYYGIYAWGDTDDADTTCGNIDISDITLNISSGDSNIYAESGLSITNSTVNAMCADCECIYVYDGDVTLRNSDITLYQHDSDEEDNDTYCLWVDRGSLTVDGCELDFSGGDCAIALYGGDLNVTNTEARLHASQVGIATEDADMNFSNSTVGIFAGMVALGTPDGSINLTGSTGVIYPANARVGKGTLTEENYSIDLITVVNEDGYLCPYVGFGTKFADVVPGSYYEEPVYYALISGITTGTGGTNFSPDQSCTRAQVVTFLWRAMGEPSPMTDTTPFTDIVPGSYYYDAVLFAVEEGITTGTSATTFAPDKACTRAEIVTFLWRACGSPEPESTTCPFTDVQAGSYYYTAMLWAAENGITTGTSATTFSPDKTCTRAEVVTFLYRLMV